MCLASFFICYGGEKSDETPSENREIEQRLRVTGARYAKLVMIYIELPPV